jgi:phosphoglycolate phosphatase
MRAARGLSPIAFANYRPHAGSGARGMLEVAFGVTPSSSDYESLRDEFIDTYRCYMFNTTVPFDGVAALLEGISNTGLIWGIVTNKAERLTFPLVQSMPILAGAGVVIGGDTTPYAKPHPQPLLEAAGRLNIAPKHCVYVGDDERDMLAGRVAAMYTVAALYGYLGAHTDADTWPTDGRIYFPEELLTWLKISV